MKLKGKWRDTKTPENLYFTRVFGVFFIVLTSL